jgi:hypothetical protein
MNNNLFFGLLLISLNYNCTEMNSQETAVNTTMQDSVYVGPTHFSDDLIREDSLYTSIIRVDKQNKDEFVLSIQMNLKKNSYFVSPNEKRDFTGKFTVVLTESEKLIPTGAMIENPISKVDHYQGNANLVRENTNYKQTLKVISTKNFEVYGYIQFTIEPRCTLEKIPFILSFVDGKLRVKMDGC